MKYHYSHRLFTNPVRRGKMLVVLNPALSQGGGDPSRGQ